MPRFSVVIPVYNEAEGVASTIHAVRRGCLAAGMSAEVIAVDDGSTDGTATVLATLEGVRVLRHADNLGYGASLKTGIGSATGDVIGIIDADGSYPAASFPALLAALTDGVDMVVGVRKGSGDAFPLLRRPGKAIIQGLAAFLVGRRIPDLNSGMRVMRRSLVDRYAHLLPDGFSFTTTITLAVLTNRHIVCWIDVPFSARVGRSTITLRRGLFQEFPNFLALVVRIITYFRPLRFFGVASLLFLLVGSVNIIRTLVFSRNVSDASLLFLVVGVQAGLMGLLADLIVRSRR